jgi:hypothetical protein
MEPPEWTLESYEVTAEEVDRRILEARRRADEHPELPGDLIPTRTGPRLCDLVRPEQETDRGFPR